MLFDKIYETTDYFIIDTDKEEKIAEDKQKDKQNFEAIMQMLEGRDIPSVIKQKFPDVILRFSRIMPPEDGENRYLSMDMILVKYDDRNKGQGTKVLKELTKLAKKEKVDIFITPTDQYQEDGDMSKGDLVLWYRKHGFEKKHKDDFRTQHSYCLYA